MPYIQANFLVQLAASGILVGLSVINAPAGSCPKYLASQRAIFMLKPEKQDLLRPVEHQKPG